MQSKLLFVLFINSREPSRIELSTFSGETKILALSVVISTVLHFSLIISVWYGGTENPIPLSSPALFPCSL